MIEYKLISEDKELSNLSILAERIWRQYYPPIIGHDQVEYMLGKMYSLQSLREQCKSGHMFAAAYEGGEMVGFLSFSKKGDGEFMIHKWYVDLDVQGKGIGRGLFDFAFGERKYEIIKLTVNRQNVQAINFYFKFGFVIEKIIDMDIGEGFVMNDFVMIFRRRR